MKTSIIVSCDCAVTDKQTRLGPKSAMATLDLSNRDSGALPPLGTISPTLSSSHACHIIGVVTAMVLLKQQLRL